MPKHINRIILDIDEGYKENNREVDSRVRRDGVLLDKVVGKDFFEKLTFELRPK